MQIATCDLQWTNATEPILSLDITNKNRSGESQGDTWPLDTQKGYAFANYLSP